MSDDGSITSKRSSFAESKQLYHSVEYDKSRRESIPISAEDDNVFDIAYKAACKLGTNNSCDMPDLLQNPSQSTTCPPSPDIVDCSMDHFTSKDAKEKFEGSVCDGIDDQKLYNSETSLISNNGRCVDRHKDYSAYSTADNGYGDAEGSTSRPLYARWVSFSELKTVIPSGDIRDNHVPASPECDQKRKAFLASSGYGTGSSKGSSSKGSLQSQVSQQTNFSDSVVTNKSFDCNDENNDANDDKDQIFDKDEPSLQNIPNLGILLSSSLSTIESTATVLQENSTDSVQLNKDLVEYSPLDLAQDETPLSSLPSHKLYANEVLEKAIKKSERKGVVSPKESVWKQTVNSAVPRNEATIELMMRYLQQLKPECLLDADTLLSDLLRFCVSFDSYSQISPGSFVGQTLSPTSTPTELTQAHVQILSNIEEQEELSDAALESMVDERLISRLERSSRCQVPACQDKECRKIKQLLYSLETNIQMGSILDEEQEKFLIALRCHCERCDDIKCSVPYCSVLYVIDPWDSCKAVSCISRQLDIILQITDAESQPTRFMPLSEACPYRSAPCEGEDWMVLSPLSRSRNIVLITDVLMKASNSQTVLKKVPLLDADHQWSVYERLQGLEHPNILQHLWVMEHMDLFICTRFCPEGSLSQVLANTEVKLPSSAFVSYMKQIIQGVLALHSRGVVFINWTACNILLCDNHRVAKVSNFSLSAVLNSDNVDYGGIKQALPAAILPPELLSASPSISELTDVWGCGCLLYELTVGRKIWHEYRHEPRDAVWKKLRGKIPPPPKSLRRWPQVFQACWQLSLEDRQPLNSISLMLDQSTPM